MDPLYLLLAAGFFALTAGLLDLGYVAFYAVGAYMFALLASPHLGENFEWIRQSFPNGLHTPIWIIIPLAAVVAGLAGVILGTAIVTLGFGEIIRVFMNNLEYPINITNGPRGISQIDSMSIGPLDFGQTAHLFGLAIPPVAQYYYLFLVLVVVSVVICTHLADSRRASCA